MAEAWQTLEEAALTLGISSRTLHRRLARGEFETRLENGRREVLVIIEDREPSLDRLAAAGRSAMSHAASAEGSATSDTSATASDTASHVTDDYGTTIEAAAEEVQQTMLALHEDRIRRTDLAIMAYQQSVTVAAADARRAVTRSHIAWGVAGALTIAMFLGGIWATHRVTQASGEVSHLSDNVQQLTDDIEVKSREIRELRQDSQAAKVAAARAEGELAAAKRQMDQLIEAQQAAARLTAQSIVSGASSTPATTQPSLSAIAATQPAPSASAATQPSATTQPIQAAARQ